MTDFIRVATTSDVFKSIMSAHPDLQVFGSYSAPDGDEFGFSSLCVMETLYGFAGCETPFIHAKTTWDKCHEKPYNRINENHEYWLCLPLPRD